MIDSRSSLLSWTSVSCIATQDKTVSFLFFLRFYLFIFRERGREGEREGEKHPWVVASCTPPARDLARNSGMCLDWKSNQQHFGSQAGTQKNVKTLVNKKKICLKTTSSKYMSLKVFHKSRHSWFLNHLNSYYLFSFAYTCLKFSCT